MNGDVSAVRQCTIPSGTALSTALPVGAFTLLAIHMPAAWTAADLTFQAALSPDGPWQDVMDGADTPAEITVGAAADIAISPLAADRDALMGFRFLRVRSGTSAAPVNQAADRVLTFVLK